MGKTGRNEPCPCGSGKKYKFCCGDSGGNIIPFPGISGDDELEDIPEGMTWQESLGMTNPATDMLHQIQNEIGDREFSSIDELNDFLREKTDRMNREPQEDFLELTPEIMHLISLLPLSEISGFLSLAGSITEEDVPGIPILRQIRRLLNQLQTGGKVKLTSSGYLPPVIALSWFDETFRPFVDKITWDICPVRKESDNPLMPWTRAVMKKMSLVFIRKGYLGISTRGKEFLQTPCPEQYRQLFYFLADEWNWSEYKNFRFEISPFHQNTLPFFLHALNHQGFDGLYEEDARRIFTAAFPDVFDSPEVDSFLFHLVISEPARNFTEPLGLSNHRKMDEYRGGVVPTELFRRELKWFPDE